MKLCIASDHRGIALKEKLKAFLRAEGLGPQDKGASGENPVDYPDYAAMVAEAVSRGDCDRGILICSTGVGMSVVANKFPGVRAALCGDAATARQCREHIDANVLVLAGGSVSDDAAQHIVKTWLNTPFAGGRHQRRLDKIATLERKLCKS
jgi:ribose 5-phosphate isomerase B